MKTRTPHLYALLLAMLTAAACYASCSPRLRCAEDFACAFGEACDATSGECVPAQASCETDSDCDGGLCSYNELTRRFRCISSEARCTSSESCGAGRFCDTISGVCRVIDACVTAADCSAGETCETVEREGECAPIGCEMSQDCPRGFVCDATSRVCTPGCVLPTSPCPSDRFCKPIPGELVGACAESCAVDTECPFGFVCEGTIEERTCEREGPCASDEECRPDEVCDTRNEECIQQPCTSNESCANELVCDPRSGTCIGAGCTDDLASPNHAPRMAAILAQNSTARYALCTGRDDWFVLPGVPEGQELTVTLRHDERSDVDFGLYDVSARALVLNERKGLETDVIWRASSTQDVFVRVFSAALRDTEYELEISGRAVNTCDDDSLEDNDTRARATRLSGTMLSTELPLTLCAGDEDWLMLTNITAEMRVDVAVTASDITPFITLWTPDGKRIQVPEAGALSLLRAGADGTYYIQLRSPLPGDVRLSLQTRDEEQCEGAEARSSPDHAELISPSLLVQQELCTNDRVWGVDWYALEAPASASTLSVAASIEDIPGLEVALFDISTTPPALIREAVQTSATTVSLEVTADEGSVLGVRVSARGQVGRLFGPANYALSYRYVD